MLIFASWLRIVAMIVYWGLYSCGFRMVGCYGLLRCLFVGCVGWFVVFCLGCGLIVVFVRCCLVVCVLWIVVSLGHCLAFDGVAVAAVWCAVVLLLGLFVVSCLVCLF